MRADEFTVDELARGCSDMGEHVTKIIEQVNSNNSVTYDNEQLDSTMVFLAMIEDDSDAVNKGLSTLSIHTPLNRKFAEIIDEKTQELAQEAARSYQGEYDV